MNKYILWWLFGLLISLPVSAQSFDEQLNPVANPEAVVVSGKMRFTVLTPEIIRIEWNNRAEFEDRATFTVVNRNLPVPSFSKEEKDGYLYLATEKLYLRYKIGTYPATNPAGSENLRIAFQMDGREVVWYPNKQDRHNLKGTMRTLDSASGDSHRGMLEDGVISRSGWAIIDEMVPRGDGGVSLPYDDIKEDVPWFELREDASTLDLYFLGYGKEYRKALGDYVRIAGRAPMPPHWVFGYWYSKYQRYSQQDFKDLVNEIAAHKIPLDIMVVDTDWHLPGWTGWSWNKELFPNPAGFIAWLHQHQLKTTLNLHPSDGIGTHEDNFEDLAFELELPLNKKVDWDLDNKDFYKAFFKHILRPHENIGVDFWWLDWQQELLVDKTSKLSNTFWLNHVFYHDMKANHPERRPLIFHRWGGLGNHRYPIGFSGDMHTNYASLEYQTYFTSTASNVAYGYWSHDIGGHIQSGENDPELYLRWIQFGAFSPILRTHSSNAANVERRIWKYDNFPLMLEAINLRYQLFPYIYTYSRCLYDTGVSICRPIYYDYPDSNEAYLYETQYLFGDEILVAPITAAANGQTGLSKRQIWLPKGNWYEAVSGEILEGDKVYERSFTQGEIPYYYKEGAIIPMYPKVLNLKDKVNELIVRFVPGANGIFHLYEDEGDNENYKKGGYATTKIEQQTHNNESEYTIYPTEGSFKGILERMTYQLEVLGKEIPETVLVNGTSYPRSQVPESGAWFYNEMTSTLCISLPEQSRRERCDISVRFSNTSSIESLRRNVQVRYSQPMLYISIDTSSSCTLDIYSVNGAKVFSSTYQGGQKIVENLAGAGLRPGVYVCKVRTNEEEVIRKIQVHN